MKLHKPAWDAPMIEKGAKLMVTDVTNAMSIGQVVSYAGLSRSTLYRLMQRGELRSLKIGSRRLVRKADIDALLESAVDRSK